MSDRILLGTRKGLFTFKKRNDGWALTSMDFPGQPVSQLLFDKRDGGLYAALNLGHFGPKLHRSHDDGRSWQELSMPAFAEAPEGEDKVSVDQIWAMATAGPDKPHGLWAGTNPGGLFYSADGGDSWTLNDGLWDHPLRQKWMGGGYDKPGIHSICVDPRDSDRVAVAVSVGGVWLSEDGGKNWEARAKGMKATYMPPDMQENPEAQDPHQMVQSPSDPDQYWVQHHCGIFRSIDNLSTFETIAPEPCSNFGFAVAVHPKDGNTAWFVPAVKDEYRYPKDGKFIASRTRDGGKSFEVLSKGLPGEASYDLVYRHGMDVDHTGEQLVMASTTGGAWVSEDGGDSWSALPCRLPPAYVARFA